MAVDKQQALLDGALEVFSRDGFTRASIQTLAAAANVSTRTIYNHYGSKEGLFKAVILDSATRVAEREIAQAERILGRVRNVREDLIEFGVAWARRDPSSAHHFRLMRQINAESDHIDPEVFAAWQEAGPRRVRLRVAELLTALDRDGVLRVGDAELAAAQLVQVTAGVALSPGVDRDVESLVAAGVDVFLAAYGV